MKEKMRKIEWRIVQKNPHREIVLCNSYIDRRTVEYSRLYISVDPDRSIDISYCEQFDSEHLGGKDPVLFQELSTHLRELILLGIHNNAPYIYLNDDHAWFNGFDHYKFEKELASLGVQTMPVFQNYKQKNARCYIRDFLVSYDVVSVVNWKNSGINPRQVVYGELPTFETRNLPPPEPTEKTILPDPIPVTMKKIDEAKARVMRSEIQYCEPRVSSARYKKYYNIGPHCPSCQSTSTEKLGMVGKLISVELFGLASNKIGKQFKCKKCGYMW